MAPTHLEAIRSSAEDRIRTRVLSALHVGRFRPGDRVPSVRRLADMTGLNHKTVHRAYTSLAREGFLEVKPGSGTFVSERRSGSEVLPPIESLLSVVRRARRDSSRLGLSSSDLARFLSVCLADGLRSISLAVVECNRDQIHMMERDLRHELGVDTKAITLAELDRPLPSILAGIDCVVTTDCHYGEVSRRLASSGIPVQAVALDSRFPRDLLAISQRHDLILVSKDVRFGRVLLRLLKNLAGEGDWQERIQLTGERRASVLLAKSRPGSWVYYSPRVAEAIRGRTPGHLHCVSRCWHVESRSVEALRVGLALQRVRETPVI